jgi:hypothetical protein
MKYKGMTSEIIFKGRLPRLEDLIRFIILDGKVVL